MKSKLRTLVVDGVRYLYRLESRYLGAPKGASFARATCVAYLDGHKTCGRPFEVDDGRGYLAQLAAEPS